MSVGAGAGRLVGRAAETAQLLDALAQARSGTGGGLALVGEAGVGKSRLSRELLAASREAQVPTLVGRAVATASAVPYRAVRESLLSWSRTRPVPAAERLGGYGRGVDHLLDDSGAEGQRLSPVFVAESYLRVLLAVAEGTGCVVLLEDLHWADDETLAVVEYVADHAESAGVLLVLTSRYDASAAARPLLDALVARGSVRPLRLSPLDRPGVGELAGQLLGGPVSPALVDLLHQRSEGVPLLVEELVSALRESGALAPGPDGTEASDAAARVLPGSVAETVRVRLDALPGPQRRVLETAAVFGRGFDWHRLAAVAGQDEDAVLESLRAATAAALLEPDPVRPGELRFRHALIRDAVAASTFPPERTRLARRALDDLLEAVGPEGRDEDLALAIELAAQCDDHATAARLALRLAWRAMMGWSLATAERRLAQARRHAGTDSELLVDIDVLQIRVASMVGRIDVVRTVGGALLARVGDSDPGTRLETHLQLGQVAAEDGDWAESRRQLDAAEPLLARAADPCHLTRHALWSAVGDGHAGATDAARGHALRAIELAAPYDDQVDLICASLLHLGRLAQPDVGEARARWQHGLRLATDHDLRLWRGRLLAELAGPAILDLAGDAELDESLALAHEAGAVELAQRVELMRAELALLRGDAEEAARRYDAAVAVTGPSAVVASTRGRADALRSLLGALRTGGESEADAPATVCALAALLRDDTRAAARLAGGADAPVTGPLAPYAALLALLDEVADGPDRIPVSGTAVGRGLEAARRARSEPDDPDRAAALLTEAATTLRPAPLLAALAVRLAAPAVLAAGAGEQVRDLLREAAGTLDRLALPRPADACRALLRDAGVAVPRRTSAQAGVPEPLRALGVTGRELEVLRLVAQGRTSREIAEQLYLSPRTVEKHVERLLTKTGAANRTALAGFAPAT